MRSFKIQVFATLIWLTMPTHGVSVFAATLEATGLKEFSVPISHEKQWSDDAKKFAQSVMSILGKDNCPDRLEKCDSDLAKLDELIAKNPNAPFLHEIKAIFLLAAP